MLTGLIQPLTCLVTGLSLLAQVATSQPTPSDESTPMTAVSPDPVDSVVLASKVHAAIRTPRVIVPVGGEVIVEFTVTNLTDKPVKLTVPGTREAREMDAMGLPLEHVFSGVNYRALSIVSESNPRMGDRIMRKPDYPVPPVTLAPFGSIGLRFDVARFYPGLHQAGLYELQWRPYFGALNSEPLLIEVVQYKQAVMETNHGSLVIDLFYDKAPTHVTNFLELTEQRFYNGKTFHAVHPSQFIIGGCPNNDGTGKRPDGVCIPPEFNDTPFELGTVGMAIIESDPTSASCQFFICLSRQPAWDGRYTAFGKVRGPESLATLRKLGSVEVDDERRPVNPLIIKSISTISAPHAASRSR